MGLTNSNTTLAYVKQVTGAGVIKRLLLSFKRIYIKGFNVEHSPNIFEITSVEHSIEQNAFLTHTDIQQIESTKQIYFIKVYVYIYGYTHKYMHVHAYTHIHTYF